MDIEDQDLVSAPARTDFWSRGGEGAEGVLDAVAEPPINCATSEGRNPEARKNSISARSRGSLTVVRSLSRTAS